MAGLTPEDNAFGNKAETDGKSSPGGDVGSSPYAHDVIQKGLARCQTLHTTWL